MLAFEGEMLYQRRDEDVIITCLLSQGDISEAYKQIWSLLRSIDRPTFSANIVLSYWCFRFICLTFGHATNFFSLQVEDPFMALSEFSNINLWGVI